MTTQEIQQYINTAIGLKFANITAESGEIMTSEGGDGRFFGKVIASKYSGFPEGREVFLAIGQTEKKVQIIKLGDSESLTPSETDLDLLLHKEFGIKKEE